MATFSDKSLPAISVRYWAGVPISTSVTPGFYYSRIFTIEPNPNDVVVKRPKPKPGDLIWNGTNYTKQLTRIRYSLCTTREQMPNPNEVYINSRGTQAYFTVDTSYVLTLPPDPMNACIAKLRDDVANIANMLGEYRQTATMFANACERLATSWRLARHGQVVAAINALGQVALPINKQGKKSYADAWLQWHFGVDTLMKDVYSLVKELQFEALEPPPLISTARKLYKRQLDTKLTPSKGNFIFVTERWRRSIVCYAEWDETALKLAADHGLTNPAGVAWELLAWSFVADWFTDIGTYIQGLDLPLYLKRGVAYETNRKHSYKRYFRDLSSLPSNYVAMDECKAVMVRKDTSRLMRALQVSRPQWNPHLSTVRVGTALALLMQVISGKGDAPPRVYWNRRLKQYLPREKQ